MTLVEDSELASMNILDIVERAQQAGIECIRYPMRDKWIPPSASSFQQLILTILSHVQSGALLAPCQGL